MTSDHIPHTRTENVVKTLRAIADALEAGKVARWELTVETMMAEVGSISGTGYVDTGRREVEFRCEVGP